MALACGAVTWTGRTPDCRTLPLCSDGPRLLLPVRDIELVLGDLGVEGGLERINTIEHLGKSGNARCFQRI